MNTASDVTVERTANKEVNTVYQYKKLFVCVWYVLVNTYFSLLFQISNAMTLNLFICGTPIGKSKNNLKSQKLSLNSNTLCKSTGSFISDEEFSNAKLAAKPRVVTFPKISYPLDVCLDPSSIRKEVIEELDSSMRIVLRLPDSAENSGSSDAKRAFFQTEFTACTTESYQGSATTDIFQETCKTSTCSLPPVCSQSALESSSRCGDPCKTDVSSDSCCPITPCELVELMNNKDKVLLLDCRAFMAYNANHINGALNVSCSDRISRKRLGDGKIGIADVICGAESKELYKNLEADADIVMYDDATREIFHLSPVNNSLKLLAECLRKRGKQSRFLEGGLQAFQKSFSGMCSQPESGGNVPLFSPTSPEVNCDIDSAIASEILPCLVIGNQRDAANRERLAELGITHILNVTAHLPFHFEEDGISYKRLPASDSGCQNLKKYFPEAIEFIDEAKRNNGKVLVHCQAGVSRSPTIAIAYLMASCQISLMEAFTQVKDQRAIIAPNLNFMGQLLEFEHKVVQKTGLHPPSEHHKLLLL